VIMLENKSTLFEYLLYLGDTSLILSHRLSEWCGHGPILEQDIALTNITLDILGQARFWYQLAAEESAAGLDEDQIAYFRESNEFRNLLLVEQPNVDWGQTVLRQYMYDCFITTYLQALTHSSDSKIAEIALRSVHESQYHYRWSSDWLLRLGAGTPKSKTIMQESLNQLWRFHQEPIVAASFEVEMAAQGIAPDLETIKTEYLDKLHTGISKAGLVVPDDGRLLAGGKQGVHTEHLGYILAEMQHVQRTYPGLEW